MHTCGKTRKKNHVTLNARVRLNCSFGHQTHAQGTLSAILIETPQIAQRILKLILHIHNIAHFNHLL